VNSARKTTCIFLLITTPLSAMAAQQNAPAAKTEQTATEKTQQTSPLLQKVASVLDRVLEAQKAFADENLRVMIQAQVADMLWPYDEPRARRLFEETLRVSERLADQGPPPPTLGVSYYPVRNQVIRLIMDRDSAWATMLIESRGEITADLKSRSSGKNRERTQLQLQLGTYFAQRDPQRAALAARPFAVAGDFNSLMLLLGRIRFKEVNAADDLFTQALAKAREGQPSFEDIRRFATYIFPSFGEGVLRFSAEGNKRDPFVPSSSSPAATAQFLNFAYDVATRRLDLASTGVNVARLDARSMLDFAIPKLLVPYFDRFLPDKSPAFRARVQDALKRVPLDERQYLVLTESGTVEELQSRADATSDTRLKDTLILSAIFQTGDNYEQAATLIERLSSEWGRSSARTSLRQRIDDKRLNEAWSALNSGDYDRTEALAVDMSNWRSDGLLVRSLVGQLSRKDKPRAARILEGYEQKALSIEEPTEKVLRFMQLASVAATIDSNRGFEEMKRSIEEFNQSGFVPELERYRDRKTAGPGSLEKVNLGLSGLLGNWDLYWMGQTDIDRAVALTQQFQMKEAAALMLLNVCRGALRNVPASAR
jgi:hypothetical protein